MIFNIIVFEAISLSLPVEETKETKIGGINTGLSSAVIIQEKHTKGNNCCGV